MLKKLLKYELKSIFKFLIIFYSIGIFFATLTRIFFSIENSFVMNILGQICSGTAISMMCSILINNLMRMWVRFKQNFYADESYLTHTLPIKKGTLYLSKFLTAIITLFTSILVITLILFIAYYSKENILFIKNLLLPVASVYGSTITKIILAFLFICFLEFLNILLSGFTGIILGHKMNSNKMGFSVLYGFITYLLTQIIAIVIVFIVAIFNKDIMNLFYTVDALNIDVIKLCINLAMIIYSSCIIVLYFINLREFNKGVNID